VVGCHSLSARRRARNRQDENAPRLIGSAIVILINDVLDDTGSDWLEIYRDEALNLGLTAQYGFFGEIVDMDTASGQIRRQTFEMEVWIIQNGAPWGPFFRCNGQEHCSGMFLRKNLFRT